MKKIIILGVSFLMLISLFGCGENNDEVEEKQWPENEFTKQVSKPEFGDLNGAVEIDDEFCISINDVEINEVKSYVEIIQKEGFKENQDVIDKEAIGIEVYSYMADSKDGYSIALEYSVGVCSLTITK